MNYSSRRILLTMKFYLRMRCDILQAISHCRSSVKPASTQATEVKKLNKNLFCRRKEVSNICSIVTAINHVSWAKISLSDLSLTDWNSYSLPQDFQKPHMELNVLTFANELSKLIPSSDLYMMERQKKFTSSLNEIYLKAMLIFLVCLNKDQEIQDKLYMQHPSVLNRACKLLVGSERKSARPIVSDILELKTQNDISSENEEYPDWYLSLEIPEEHRNCFLNSTMEKQESLSLALLLSLSYLNKYFEQQEDQNKKIVKNYFVKVSQMK